MDVVKKNSIGFALFHATVFAGFFIFMHGQTDVAQHQLYWIFWLIIDFPISLIVVLAFTLGAGDNQLLYFVHGVLGTVWWYFLPKVLLAIDPRSKK